MKRTIHVLLAKLTRHHLTGSFDNVQATVSVAPSEACLYMSTNGVKRLDHIFIISKRISQQRVNKIRDRASDSLCLQNNTVGTMMASTL